MESNINFSEITQYSKNFTETACNLFFKDKESISGQEILKLTPIQQVNLFVVYELLTLWNIESAKLKSPYFNYDNPEVQEALRKMMNTLSRNILIKKEDLLPLLHVATEKSILLIFSPYQFYKNEIENSVDGRLKIVHLEEMKKYVKVNRHLLDQYIDRLKKEDIEEIFSEEAVRMFDEVCQNTKESPDDFEAFIPHFSEIVNLDINAFYRESPEDPAPKAESPTYNGEAEVHNLNESLHRDVETLADIHEKRRIDGIKKNITINQRFMFVNELFGGNADEFESVVTYLDNCDKKSDAMSFIMANCIEAKGWDQESEEVAEFMYVVQKRFPD